MGDKVGELDDVAGVRVDEGFVPHGLGVVSDLHDVCEGDRAILLRDKLELGRVLVVFRAELAISLGDCVCGRDGGGSGRHVGCSKKTSARCHREEPEQRTRLDERGAEGDDLVSLIECDVGHCIRNRDAILQTNGCKRAAYHESGTVINRSFVSLFCLPSCAIPCLFSPDRT